MLKARLVNSLVIPVTVDACETQVHSVTMCLSKVLFVFRSLMATFMSEQRGDKLGFVVITGKLESAVGSERVVEFSLFSKLFFHLTPMFYHGIVSGCHFCQGSLLGHEILCNLIPSVLYMKFEFHFLKGILHCTNFPLQGTVSMAYDFLCSSFELFVLVSAFPVSLVGEVVIITLHRNDLVCDPCHLAIFWNNLYGDSDVVDNPRAANLQVATIILRATGIIM